VTNVGKPKARATSQSTSESSPPQSLSAPDSRELARASDSSPAAASRNPARDAAARHLAAVLELRADAQADELRSMLEDSSIDSPSSEIMSPATTANPTTTVDSRTKRRLACERIAWEHRPKVWLLSCSNSCFEQLC
jgi:hypothetical protein